MERLSNALDDMMIGASIRAGKAFDEFRENQDGDTNFISMLLVIGIVVVLATAFKGLADQTMAKISQNVKQFVDSLGG